MPVGDRLLDDVPQIQDVALRQPPQARWRSAGPPNRPTPPTAAPSSLPVTVVPGRLARTRRASKVPVSQPESAHRPAESAEPSRRLAARPDPERTSTDRRAGAGRLHPPRRARPTTRQSASRSRRTPAAGCRRRPTPATMPAHPAGCPARTTSRPPNGLRNPWTRHPPAPRALSGSFPRPPRR